jgi:type I restriction enzyme S subunit
MSDRFTEVRLGELAYFEMGQSPPSSCVSEDEVGLPFLQGNAEFGAAFPTPESYCSEPKKTCKPGDILISVRAPVGDLNKADQTYTIGRGLAAIRFTEISTEFGWQLLNYWAEDLDKVAQGTTFKAISKRDLGALELLLPPLSEQRRIAEILDAADEAIRRSERVIAKLREVKKGLLHDLLTRGLDADGNLRDPEAHPEQFRDSPLGRIPREWEVLPLIRVVPRADYGVSVPLDYGRGTPVLRMNNLENGEVDLSDLKTSDSKEAATLLLEPLDVLFNRTNSMEHVGRTGIWRGQLERASFASYLVRLVPDPEWLNSEYLNLWLNSRRTQLMIRRYATPGVSQVNINPTNLRKTLIALPDTSAQGAIVRVVATHDARIGAEEAALEKLRQVKRGLMDDLLTGRVRV